MLKFLKWLYTQIFHPMHEVYNEYDEKTDTYYYKLKNGNEYWWSKDRELISFNDEKFIMHTYEHEVLGKVKKCVYKKDGDRWIEDDHGRIIYWKDNDSETWYDYSGNYPYRHVKFTDNTEAWKDKNGRMLKFINHNTKAEVYFDYNTNGKLVHYKYPNSEFWEKYDEDNNLIRKWCKLKLFGDREIVLPE